MTEILKAIEKLDRIISEMDEQIRKNEIVLGEVTE